MKIKKCMFIFLMLPVYLFANHNIDSLWIIVKNGPDTARLNAYEHLSNIYMNRDFDSSFLIYEEGKALAEKLQKAPQINLFLTNLATIYYQKSEFEKAVFYFLEALKVSEKFKDTTRIAQTLNNLGIINMYSGENEKALDYLHRSKIIKQQLKNNELTVAITNMNIGIIYKNLGNYDQAYEYFIMALPEIEKQDKKSALAPIYNNIGIVFLFRKQYDKALEYYLKAEIYADNYLPAYSRAVLMQNIGECYMFLKKPKKAFSYLNKGLELALEKGNLHVQKNIYNVLCDYYLDEDDYRSAYKYREKYDLVKDSVFNLEKKTMIEELQTKYETEKKDQENLLLNEQIHVKELEASRQKNLNNLLILVVILIMLVIILLTYFLRRIKKINVKLKKNSKYLQKLNDDLNASKNEIEVALGFKTQFIANMSHEIRTPLNIIIGFNLMLKKNISDTKLLSFVDAIDVSSNNLLQLLNDILDLSKMEAGKMVLAPDSINLSVMLDDIRKLFSLRAEEKVLDFSIELDPAVPTGLMVDEVRLRQVLVNLIGNAIKFTESGFVKLRVFIGPPKPGQVFSSNVTDLIFEIEDSGTGIAEKDQSEIFESFKQLKTHNQKKLGGTGLGLPISKRLTEMMGGKILVNSEIGRGSKFTVKLKNVPILPQESNIQKSVKNLSAFTDIIFSKGCIVAADDEDLNRSLIKAYFENTKVEIIEAESGDEAISLTQKHLPDLVLMDLKMPDKNGFEAAREIKNNISTKHIPIIAITASHLLDDQVKEDKELFAGFISKPVFIIELFNETSRFITHTHKFNPEDILNLETEFERMIKKDRLTITADAIYVLENDFIPRWTKVFQSNSMNQILEFSDTVKTFADNNNILVLQNYADEISYNGKSFDIDKVMILGKKFPEIIQSLKLTN
jgi:signal transduction histidine kinase/CheY-like chemotaxis protein